MNSSRTGSERCEASEMERNKDTECREHLKGTLEREVSRAPFHLLTDNSTDRRVGVRAAFSFSWCECVRSAVLS